MRFYQALSMSTLYTAYLFMLIVFILACLNGNWQITIKLNHFHEAWIEFIVILITLPYIIASIYVEIKDNW